MSEQPRNQALIESYIGDLDELLQKPFHVKGYLEDASGKRNALGLAVGKSWIEHRHAVVLALPFAAEAAPTPASVGIPLYPYEQARLYLEFTGALAGTEAMTVRIWHRHVAYDDALSFGPWTMWKEIDNIHHLVEHLDNGLYHREIYVQLVTYGPLTATATAVNVWVAGATGIVESSFADVNVDAGDLDVHISAIPEAPGETADSVFTYDGDLGERRVVPIDGGSITPPVAGGNVVQFTGVMLAGKAWKVFNLTERTWHHISSAITDPAGGGMGTFTIAPPVVAANCVLLIPYQSTPHAWNSAADAEQTMAVVGDPPRINGPVTFISQTAATDNGTYQWVIPCALYGRWQLQIIWSTAAGTRTVQFRSYGKVDDAAWPLPAGGPPTVTTINQALCIDDKWDPHTLGGATQFGAVAAGNGTLVARILEQTGYHSIAVEAVVAGDDANNTVITAYYTLYGATK
jgi:hypothetical protein